MIVYPERGLALNETATEIVKRCDGTRTIAQIVEELRQGRVGDDHAAIQSDVLELLKQLSEKGLLES